MLLLFGTGARLGEIAGLTSDDVNLEEGILSIRKGKTGARLVPVHAELVDALRAWGVGLRGAGIFGVTRNVVWSHLGGKHLRAACETAGVERFTPHGLRRAAVDMFADAQIDPKVAAAHFGHSVEVMLEHDRRATLDDRRAAVAATRLGATSAAKVIPFPQAAT
jgi:integrase